MHAVKINTVIESDILRVKNLGFLKGRLVEVTIKPVENTYNNSNGKHNLKGSLKNFADKKLMAKEKDAWKAHVKDKNDN